MAHTDVATDQNGDRLCSPTHDASNDAQKGETNDEVSTSKDIRDATNKYQRDTQRDCVYQSDLREMATVSDDEQLTRGCIFAHPDIVWIWTNVFIDDSKYRRGISKGRDCC